MLLSSQAFSGFLSELSGTAPPSSTGNLQQPQTSLQSQSIPKDVNPHQVARQLQNKQQQIGMAIIPEQSVDFSLVETNPPSSSWNPTIGLMNYPVYSLIELPDGPAVDVEILSAKAHGGSLLQAYEIDSKDAAKQDMPNIEYARPPGEMEEFPSPLSLVHTGFDSTLDTSDTTAFTLYSDLPSTFRNNLPHQNAVLCGSRSPNQPVLIPMSFLAQMKRLWPTGLHRCALNSIQYLLVLRLLLLIWLDRLFDTVLGWYFSGIVSCEFRNSWLR